MFVPSYYPLSKDLIILDGSRDSQVVLHSILWFLRRRQSDVHVLHEPLAFWIRCCRMDLEVDARPHINTDEFGALQWMGGTGVLSIFNIGIWRLPGTHELVVEFMSLHNQGEMIPVMNDIETLLEASAQEPHWTERWR